MRKLKLDCRHVNSESRTYSAYFSRPPRSSRLGRKTYITAASLEPRVEVLVIWDIAAIAIGRHQMDAFVRRYIRENLTGTINAAASGIAAKKTAVFFTLAPSCLQAFLRRHIYYRPDRIC